MDRTVRSVAVELVVRVPINAPGSLVDGARGVLERVEVVEAVYEPQVRGIEPGLNDTEVELRTELEIAVGERGEDTALVRRRLETGVGVLSVDRLESHRTDPETQFAVRETEGGDR